MGWSKRFASCCVCSYLSLALYVNIHVTNAVQRHFLLHGPRTTPACHGVPLDYGPTVSHDGVRFVQCFLAVFRHASASDVGACGILFTDWKCSGRRGVETDECCYCVVFVGLGVCTSYFLCVHDTDQYGIFGYIWVCDGWGLGAQWRLLGVEYWGFRKSDEVAKGM